MAFLPLLLILLVIACSPAERASPDAERVTVRSAGDTTFVHSAGPRHDTARLVPVLSVGTFDGASEAMLHQVRAFLPGRDGEVYVADGDGLRVFDGEGRFLRRIAGVGRGPGEVETVWSMAEHPDGGLPVLDAGNRRITRFGPDGAPLDHWSLPADFAIWRNRTVQVLDDGRVVTELAPGHPADGSPESFPLDAWGVWSAGGEVTDTIRIPARYLDGCPARGSAHWRGGWFDDVRVDYVAKVTWAMAKDGSVAIGCPADYEIDVVRPDGSVLRIGRDHTPVVVSSEEARRFVELQEASRTRLNPGAWSWRGPGIGRERPAYRKLHMGERGRLWVLPSFPRVEEPLPERAVEMGLPRSQWADPERRHFDVFDRDGAWLGTVRIPPGMRYEPYPAHPAPVFDGDTVWALRTDSLDVPYVTRYLVEWPGG